MATLNFEVQYDQPDQPGIDGTISFIYQGDSGSVSNSLPANGRLDQVNDMVTSVGSFPVTLSGAEFDAVVECIRTGVDKMDVKVVFFGTVFDGADNPMWTGTGYGYGYGTGNQEPVLQTVIEDVPIDF